jgi:hypothetical protein
MSRGPRAHRSVAKPLEAGFSDRLAYARWVRQLDRRGEETDAEFAQNAGIGAKWLSKWKDSAEPPSRMNELRSVAAYLGTDVVWLWSGDGAPPRPALWAEWITARRRVERGVRRITEPVGEASQPRPIPPAAYREMTEAEIRRTEAELGRRRTPSQRRKRGSAGG